VFVFLTDAPHVLTDQFVLTVLHHVNMHELCICVITTHTFYFPCYHAYTCVITDAAVYVVMHICVITDAAVYVVMHICVIIDAAVYGVMHICVIIDAAVYGVMHIHV
jgi:hypothetical protein